jgi:hypothetical protein
MSAATLDDMMRTSVQERAEAGPDSRAYFVPLLLQWGLPDEDLPPWWTPQRDRELRKYWKREGLLASTIYNMQAILSTVGWTVEGKDELVTRARQPLDDADFGAGLKTTIKKLAEDWFTQDNGCFIEIIGPGNVSEPLLEPPTGIAHLDAGRCWRSDDAEHPVWYLNERTFKWHKLHWTRVAFSAANPSAQEEARGIGYCAVSRVAAFARIMKDTVRYKQEKIGGRQTRALIAASGIPKDAIETAMKEAANVADNAGLVKFSAIPIIAAPTAGKELNLQMLELAGLLDGFDWQDELTMYMYILALAFGMDARELWPATSSGATKADAEVQHRKAMRKGMGDFLSTIAHIFNQRVMPEGCTFEFSPKDAEEDQQQATLEKTRVEVAAALIDKGIVTKRGAMTYLVNAGVLPAEYLTNAELADLTEQEPEDIVPPGGTLPSTQDESDEREGGGSLPVAEDEAEKSIWRRLMKALGFIKKKSIVGFRIRLQALFREYYRGAIETRFNFVDLMYSSITQYYREAWLEGAKEAGITSLDELTPQEQMTLQGLINTDFSYVLGVAEFIETRPHENESADISGLYDRAELWVNRYNAIKAQAQTSAAADKKYRWVYGDTEHCATCNALNGRVYRGSVWSAHVLPQSRRLDCGGWRCQCRLEETSDRITPGRFPKSLLVN